MEKHRALFVKDKQFYVTFYCLEVAISPISTAKRRVLSEERESRTDRRFIQI
jgi:hypothetical protein